MEKNQEKIFFIILPMFNEEKSIEILRKMFGEKFQLPFGCKHRIIIVNDGSTDRTPELAAKWEKEDRLVTVLTHKHNLGLGQAILTGFQKAIQEGAEGIVTMDADASHPAQIIPQMVQEINSGADIVIASRFTAGSTQKGVPWHRRLYTAGARVLLASFFPLEGVKDYTVGFRAYRAALIREALKKSCGALVTTHSFAASAEILLKVSTIARNIKEVPLTLRYDQKESLSKMKAAAAIKDYLKLCLMPKKTCLLGRGIKLSSDYPCQHISFSGQ